MSALLFVIVASLGLAGAATTGSTERVSVDSSGAEAADGSYESAITPDGRFVVFSSAANSLVAGDTNGVSDIFIRDRQANTTERVSVDSAGGQANGNGSYSPSITTDGRFVTFSSGASNLIVGDINSSSDIFIRDRETNTTGLVSVDTAGMQGTSGSVDPSISSTGRFIVFQSFAPNMVADDTNGAFDIFVRDLQTNTTERVSVDSSGAQAAGGSFNPSITPDGRFVVFDSVATNLVAGDTNSSSDVFIRDRQESATERPSVGAAAVEAAGGGSYSPAVSSDGRFVAFHSNATNLTPGDTNAQPDVFVRDRQAGETERVNVDSTGAQAVAGGFEPAISSDGRFVAFSSGAANLVAGDTNALSDIFVRDRQGGVTARVSVGNGGVQGVGGHAQSAAISPDGRFVTFDSGANNLVPGDTNGAPDIFVHDRLVSNNFLIAKPKLNKKKGTAKVKLTLPGAGKAELLGNKNVKASKKLLAGAGSANLAVKAKGKAAKALKTKGKVKLTLKFRFTPTGGEARTVSKKVTLKRKVRRR